MFAENAKWFDLDTTVAIWLQSCSCGYPVLASSRVCFDVLLCVIGNDPLKSNKRFDMHTSSAKRECMPEDIEIKHVILVEHVRELITKAADHVKLDDIFMVDAIHRAGLDYLFKDEINHVYYMSGDAWKEGGLDATGALMVMTLKVISCPINYNDGLLKEEDLRESQKKNRLIKLPSLIEYVGFCLCCGSQFAGPVYEIKDYMNWTGGNGIWMKSEKGSPSPFGPALGALLQAGFCMGLYMYLVPHYPLSKFTKPIYQEWGFWKRLSYQYMTCFTARRKYYFIWSISESAIIISGLGFSGWTDSSSPKAKWDRAKNVDITRNILLIQPAIYRRI